MSSVAPSRPHFQQLATLVRSHAAARGWPAVTYQGDFRTVVRVGSGRPTLQGNSVFWNSDWDADVARVDHAVGVESGVEAWQAFLQKALYPDLLRADAELLKL
jgi:hypothetical protein